MISHTASPFNPKCVTQNKVEYKLYETVKGAKISVAANSTSPCRILVPYTKCFFTSLSAISSIDFLELDFHFEVSNGQGGFTSIFQHGDKVYLPKGLFSQKSAYEAELTNTIYITAYVTNPSGAAVDFAMNVTLHNAVEA